MKAYKYIVIMQEGDNASLWFIRHAHQHCYMEHQNQYMPSGNPIYMMSDDISMAEALSNCPGVISFDTTK